MSPGSELTLMTASHLIISAREHQNIPMVWGWALAAQSKVPTAPVITAGEKLLISSGSYSKTYFQRCDHGFIHCVKHGATAYHHGIGEDIAW